MQLWQQKLWQILHYFWTSKWELKNGPKNGARIWPPKWSLKMAPKREAQYFISCRSFSSQNIWHPFGCHFWVPFLDTILGAKFWRHFWVHFSTPSLVLIFRFAAEEAIFWLPTVVKSFQLFFVQTLSLQNCFQGLILNEICKFSGVSRLLVDGLRLLVYSLSILLSFCFSWPFHPF